MTTLSRYLTRLIWLCVTPLLIYSGWLAYEQVRAQQTEVNQEAEHIARNFATALDQHLFARIGALKILTLSSDMDDPTRWPRLYEAMSAFHSTFHSHVLLVRADSPPRMLINTRVPLGKPLPALPKPAGQAALPRTLATGEPTVGDLFWGPVAQEPLIALAVPVTRQGKIPYVLLATFEARRFQERLEQVVLPSGWYLSLLDGQGKAIARHGGKAISPEAVARRVRIPSQLSGWSVVLEIPGSVYYAPLVSSAIALALGVLVAGAIGISGGLWGRRRLSDAVSSLVEEDGANPHAFQIEEITQVKAKLRTHQERITAQVAAQDQAIEEERRRVAREVHDQIGQIFTALRLILQSVPSTAYPPGQEAALGQALDLGIASTRRITAELRPPLLDDLGLLPALEHYLKDLTRTAGLECDLQIEDHERLTAAQALTLFRITQEAVTNVLRHAQAHHLRLTGHLQDTNYRFKIEDDGRGFTLSETRRDALGLISMKERAARLGGQCRIEPAANGGTLVTVSLPLAPATP